jgi:hypothetical protein
VKGLDGNRLNGFLQILRFRDTWLKPGVNEIMFPLISNQLLSKVMGTALWGLSVFVSWWFICAPGRSCEKLDT